jgi:hypothetical protein
MTGSKEWIYLPILGHSSLLKDTLTPPVNLIVLGTLPPSGIKKKQWTQEPAASCWWRLRMRFSTTAFFAFPPSSAQVTQTTHTSSFDSIPSAVPVARTVPAVLLLRINRVCFSRGSSSSSAPRSFFFADKHLFLEVYTRVPQNPKLWFCFVNNRSKYKAINDAQRNRNRNHRGVFRT